MVAKQAYAKCPVVNTFSPAFLPVSCRHFRNSSCFLQTLVQLFTVHTTGSS